MRVAVSIELKDEERQLLERLSRSRSTSVRLAERSRIVLLAAQKKTNGKIAEELEISRQKAGRWRDRYHPNSTHKCIA
ncbi:MAG: helix-turn-helix domain-containing protein [Candidatus Sedimenticola endophacoides]